MSDLKSQAKSGRRSVWKVSRAMTVIAALFLASCAPAVQGDGDQGSLQPPQTQPPHTQPSPNESEDQSGSLLSPRMKLIPITATSPKCFGRVHLKMA